MTEHKVFISHSHLDNSLCDQYANALIDRGITVWYDRADREFGQILPETIEQSLRDSSALIIMYSPNALASGWVKLETSAYYTLWTKSKQRIILPVMIVKCELPLLMQGFKWIDATSMRFEATLSAILSVFENPEPYDRGIGGATRPASTKVNRRMLGVPNDVTITFTIIQRHSLRIRTHNKFLVRGFILLFLDETEIADIEITFAYGGIRHSFIVDGIDCVFTYKGIYAFPRTPF